MKNVTYIVTLLALLIGCNNEVENRQEGIKGRWEVVYYVFDEAPIALDDPNALAEIDYHLASYDSMKKYKGDIFMIYADSMYKWQFGPTSYSGIWNLMPDDSTIVHYLGTRKNMEMSNDTIKLLTSNELIIYSARDKRTIYYKRVD